MVAPTLIVAGSLFLFASLPEPQLHLGHVAELRGDRSGPTGHYFKAFQPNDGNVIREANDIAVGPNFLERLSDEALLRLNAYCAHGVASAPTG